MIGQGLKINGPNIVKDDESLFTAWGHNYTSLTIPDIGASDEIIENVWMDHLYADGGVFNITNVSWVSNGETNAYDITLTLSEPLSNNSFVVNETLITIAGSPQITATMTGGGSTTFSIDGPSGDYRSPITGINTVANTITFTQYFPFGLNVQTGSASFEGILGIGSIELDLAILKQIANTKIIRICLQFNKFMLDDEAHNAALEDGGGDTIDQDSEEEETVVEAGITNIEVDPYAVNEAELQRLYDFCDLAAKYDIYVIVGGTNSWIAGEQQDWLAWSTEEVRWEAQAAWWRAVANTIGKHPAVAWYSLINEPIDQNEDVVLYQSSSNQTTVTENEDGTYDIRISAPTKDSAALLNAIYNFNPPAVGYDLNYLTNKYGKPGYAIITDKNQALDDDGSLLTDDLGNPVYLNYCALVRYDDLSYYEYFGSNNLLLSGVTIEPFGKPNEAALVAIGENITDPTKYGSMYLSFINKAADIFDLKIKVQEGSSTGIIDLASNKKEFEGPSSTTGYTNNFGFIGESAYTAFSSTLIGNYSGITRQNYGSAAATLSSVAGYGQILTNYASGNTRRINSVNFGHADFLSYGLNSSNTRGGNNDKFFIQTLRFALSRLRSKSVTKFTSGSFIEGSSTQQSLSGVSGYTYRRSTASAKAEFTTGTNFAGETIGIGFMVENGSEASATITINGRSYTQSLTSGVDVLYNSSDPLPIVKRLENIEPGNQTITIQLNVVNGSACLDYWQIESLTPAPIIVSSVDNNALPQTVDLTNYENPVINWNRSIVDLIRSEFIDGSIHFIDINTPLNSTLRLEYPANYTGTYQAAVPNSSGQTKQSNAYSKYITDKNLIPSYGVSVSGLEATYTCSDPHELQVNDEINIINAFPSTLNGKFKITQVVNEYKFKVQLTSTISGIPSAVSPAGFYLVALKENTTYKVSTSSTSIPEGVTFTTGNTIVGNNNGHYTVTLSNSSNILDSPSDQFEECSIINNNHWLGSSFYGKDRHYFTYITLTPLSATGRTKNSIARQWLNKIIGSIQEVDTHTPIAVQNLFSNESGFNLTNIHDIIDIISPHQYPSATGSPVSMTTMINNLITASNYEMPVILEEGAVPPGLTEFNFAVAQEYLLKSKRYLAGALNNYLIWTNNYSIYQNFFDRLQPFMDDAPINDENKTSQIISSYGTTGKNDTNVNKPKIIGKRILSPFEDINFVEFNEQITEPPVYPGITVNGSYVLKRQLVKSGSPLPESTSTYVYYDDQMAKTNEFRISLNGFKKTPNQKIASINTVVNLELDDYPMILRNYIPTNYSPTPPATPSGWTVYQPSGTYDIISIMNVNNNTTLSGDLGIDDTHINVNSVTPFPNSTGIVKVGDEYINYSAKSTSPARLTIAANGRGVRETRPQLNYSSGATVNGSMPNNAYGVQTQSITGSSILWPLSTPSSTPAGREITKIVLYSCISIDTNADLTSNRTIPSGTSTVTIPSGATNARLEFANATAWPTLPAFKKGAEVSGNGVPAGATISGFGSTFPGAATVDVNNSNHRFIQINFPTTSSSQSVTASTQITARYIAQQSAEISITDRTGFFTYYKILYKGAWINNGTYSINDIVYYQNALWRSKTKNINQTPSASNTTHWQRYSLTDDYIDTTSGFVWVPITLFSFFGIWIDPFLSVITNSTWFDPLNLGIKVQNVNTNDPILSNNNPVSKFIKISKVYADSYISGYLEPIGRTVLQAQLWKSQDYPFVEQSSARINFTAPENNVNGQWITSASSINPIIDNEINELNFTEANALTNNSQIRFLVPISSTPASVLPESYMKIKSLRINTAYAEVQMQELLSRKGSPIVSM